jgi:formylglycine-generating enzyme
MCAWWQFERGADWRHPLGPTSSLEGLELHGVVHIAYCDAEAYAKWAKKDLPTEAEWEFAARGGLDRAAFAWGEELLFDGQHMAGIRGRANFPGKTCAAMAMKAPLPSVRFPRTAMGLMT